MVALANNTELCLEGEVLSGLMSAKGYGFIMTSNGFNTHFWPKLIEHSYVAGPILLLPSFQWKPRASAHGRLTPTEVKERGRSRGSTQLTGADPELSISESSLRKWLSLSRTQGR